jgi:hypothetical protein
MAHETRLALESWREQQAHWPVEGRHILAQYDEASVVVYQAYRPEIGRYAAQHGRFGGEFSLTRMSWIKPKRTQARLFPSGEESRTEPSCCALMARE